MRGVYGVLLNFKGALARLGDAAHRPPYNQPPRAPILYIKPANTWSSAGAEICVPVGQETIESGATVGVVIGRVAVRVPESRSLDCVRGLVVANDWSLPHASMFRPAIKERCRDGYCTIGNESEGPASLPDLSNIEIRTYVNNTLKRSTNTRDLVRRVPQLLADISEFMTLHPGDIVLLGVAEDPPLAHIGDIVRIEAEGIGSIENRIVGEMRSDHRASL